jgi:membrane complex biogenesis BtpA family protein
MSLSFFGSTKPVIGMLHVPPLPGSPHSALPLDAVMKWVMTDAKALTDGGADGLLIENFGDVPFYPARVPPHTVAFLTTLATEVRRHFQLPMGVNVLRNDAESALAVAAAAQAQFVRVNIHVGARVTDQGLIQGAAHETLRYRKWICPEIQIFADVDVKHSAPLTPRHLNEEVEETVGRGSADAVIVTGSATGKQTRLEDLRIVKQTAGAIPVVAGSGVDLTNVSATLEIADAVIIGTAFKRDNITTNPVDTERVRAIVKVARTVR